VVPEVVEIDTGLFPPDAIVIVEVVETDDFVATLK